MYICRIRRRIDCEQLCSSINQQLIAGRFGHEGQLCIKWFCVQLTKAFMAETSAISCWLILLRNCSQSTRLYIKERGNEPLRHDAEYHLRLYKHTMHAVKVMTSTTVHNTSYGTPIPFPMPGGSRFQRFQEMLHRHIVVSILHYNYTWQECENK